MRIRQIDPSDDVAFSAWFAVYDAVQKHDQPCGAWWLEREARVIHEGTDYRDIVLWVADDEGDSVGAAGLDMPLKDNQRLATVEIAVRPDHRRRGIGTALLRVMEKEAADRGRTSLLVGVHGSTSDKPSPGMYFAERHGFIRRITDIMRVQRPPFQMERLTELEQEALRHAAGYELVTWHGRIPDEHIAEYARLAGRMSTDVPLGDLDYEPELWDEERVRLGEDRRIRMGRDWWCTVAVAPDRTLAGMTEIGLAVDSDHSAFQGDTIVDRPHRGHRLGLLLKIANLRALLADRPGVQAIWTWNAASNRHMISVNERLGYAKAGWEAMYQRD
ncbi:MAG TPA: GNAT family N-acetyltransferase [Jiangellaceae bacterium]|nr:GNAT family N-acetyltransferase [Jiangellaceae bacterium]